MSNKQEFIEFVEKFVTDMPEGAQKYFEAMKSVPEKEKPMFTDGGKQILKYLQDDCGVGTNITAKEIGGNLGVSSRSVSGSIRKLVTDGYVEKVSTDPVVYALTEKGMEVTID